MDCHLSRAGKLTVQTVTVLSHLTRYAQLYGLPCHSARYSNTSEPVTFLPSSISKVDVYNDCCDQWKTIVVSACTEKPTQTVPKFQKVWNQLFPSLRECRGETGYCDTCQTLSATILEFYDDATKFVSKKFSKSTKEMRNRNSISTEDVLNYASSHLLTVLHTLCLTSLRRF